MDKCREEFEAWAKCNALELDVMIDGSYYMATTYHAWQAWKASRAAIKVALPMWEHLPNGNQACNLTEIKGALKDAGITYE